MNENDGQFDDRRSGFDRRESPRVKVSVNVEWENLSGRHTGVLSDISTEGCFVLASAKISDGDTLRIWLPTVDGAPLEILGEVKNQAFEIGFAVMFLDITDENREAIRLFAEANRSDS